MNALRVIEIAACLALVAVVILQVILPAARGQRLFPWFRRQRKLEGELAQEVQHTVEEEIEHEIHQLRKRPWEPPKPPPPPPAAVKRKNRKQGDK